MAASLRSGSGGVHTAPLLRAIQGDLRHGTRAVWPRFAVLAAVAAFAAVSGWLQVCDYLSGSGVSSSLTLGDSLLCVLGGMRVYDPGAGRAFVFPMAWLSVMALAAYVTLDWPLRDLDGFGARLIVTGGSRWRWWLAKCTWVCVMAAAIWALLMAVSSGLAVATGGGLGDVPATSTLRALEFDGPGLLWASGHLGGFAVASLSAMIALLLAQMAVSLLLGPYLALGVTMSLLFFSAFYSTPWLLGTQLMAARSSAVLAGGAEPVFGAALSCAVAVLSVVVGGWLFARSDVMGREG